MEPELYMPMVMMVLSTKDHRTIAQAWRTARGGLESEARRRMRLRGRSSLMRELLLWGYEQASADPEAFLRYVRDTRDPLVGQPDGRKDRAADRREELLEVWGRAFADAEGVERRKRSAP